VPATSLSHRPVKLTGGDEGYAEGRACLIPSCGILRALVRFICVIEASRASAEAQTPRLGYRRGNVLICRQRQSPPTVFLERFFATVFFGSGLLFLGMLFTSAATVGAILMAFAADSAQLINSAAFRLARTTAYNILNIYTI
jgi:hypothetical protein